MKVYLDNNSIMPFLKEVKTKIIEAMETPDLFGNPSCLHQTGTIAKYYIDIAREQFGSSLNKTDNEFIFTSSATESNNTMLKGVFLNDMSRGKHTHIITSTIEHPSIINTCKYLMTKDVEITYIPVDSQGFIDIDKLKQSIKPHTSLISIMYANNEIGTIQPISEIGCIAKEYDIPFHSDASYAFMKTAITPAENNIDFLTVSSHTLGAPQGIGALFYNNDKIHIIDPLLTGCYQENELRASTEPIIQILAFAEAIKTLKLNNDERLSKMKRLTNKLQESINTTIPDVIFNGTTLNNKKLPNTLNYSFLGTESQSLLLQLDSVGISVSMGSACSSANSEASHVIRALGKNDAEAYSSIGFSLGWQTTEEEIDYTIEKLPQIINLLRK